jgi:hypothetical protein
LLFAFNSHRISQLGHPQLISQFYTLLFLWGVIRWVRDGERAHWKWIALAVLGFLLQLYSAFYLGWFIFLGSFVAGIFIWRDPERKTACMIAIRTHRRELAWIGAATVLLLIPFVRVHGAAAREMGLRHWGDVCAMLPRPHSWFYLGEGSWLYSWQDALRWFRSVPHEESRLWTTGLPMRHEHRIGIGLLTSVLSLVGVYRLRQHRWFGLMFPLILTIALATTAWFHYRVTFWHLPFYLLPGANGVRALARVIMLLIIPLSLGLGLFLDRLRPAVAWALVLLCLMEQGRTTPSYAKNYARQRVREVIESIPAGCRFFLYAPTDRGQEGADHAAQMDAMWASLETGVPTLNGLSGGEPRTWHLQWIMVRTPEDSIRLRDAAHAWLKQQGMSAEGLCVVEGKGPGG